MQLLLEAEVDGRLHATEGKVKGLIELVHQEIDPDVKHLQEEYAETKVHSCISNAEFIILNTKCISLIHNSSF